MFNHMSFVVINYIQAVVKNHHSWLFSMINHRSNQDGLFEPWSTINKNDQVSIIVNQQEPSSPTTTTQPSLTINHRPLTIDQSPLLVVIPYI